MSTSSSRVSSVEIEPPTRRVPRPRMVTGWALTRAPSKSRSLADPALVPELLELPRVDAVAGALELLLQPSRERQIHVVAAQQDVLAHGDAAQRERAALLADRDEAEVGGAAAHVAHQHQVAHLHALAPGVALRGEPRVERRLGLFEEAHARQAGLRRRPQRQLPGLLVERGGHGHEHLLVGERRVVAAARVLPRARQVRQVARRREHGRHAANIVRRLPRQDVGGPVHARVREPRLRRRHQAGRVLGAALARELADHRVGLAVPRQRDRPGREIRRTRQEEERRQERGRGDLAGIDQLRDALHGRRRIIARARVDVRERAVRRAEVDADDEPGVHVS